MTRRSGSAPGGGFGMFRLLPPPEAGRLAAFDGNQLLLDDAAGQPIGNRPIRVSWMLRVRAMPGNLTAPDHATKHSLRTSLRDSETE